MAALGDAHLPGEFDRGEFGGLSDGGESHCVGARRGRGRPRRRCRAAGASWLMRSLPGLNLTSSLIGASLLAHPGIDHYPAPRRRACINSVSSRLLVESNHGDHDLAVAGGPQHMTP
jgi:hypothetical protein